jgi:hypothetical protein
MKDDIWKDDISLVSVILVASIYASGVFTLMVYIAHSLAMGMMQARWIVEEIESVF